jgi:rubrerythrin
MRIPVSQRGKVVAVMNVFDFAMKLEEESRESYEKLAEEADSMELKTVFSLLADSEREHHEHLTILKTSTDPAVAESVSLDRAGSFIHELVGTIADADILRNDNDGYRHALKQEEISISLYDNLAKREPNSSAAALLRTLAAEERHHLEMMENIYEFVETPRTYLAWGEFSNLRDY